MFQNVDFASDDHPERFNAETILRKAIFTLADQAEYDPSRLAEALAIGKLNVGRFVSAFSVGNAGGNPIHFVRTQRGLINGAAWRFSATPVEENLARSEESRLAA